ncbi:synaptic vesicle glycoprotein 2C isoform X2 [Pristis pectinata]|uniref:synaptic vesicle glycoprotein 2C isoform X2 n=1 Tax=Pristis pectinata TaxID=685728 RepID=UPI00223D8761|nr:synaptic vesicle glycoprotein 2C isoform X2 [Pristis pectinata]XP_051898446.1 synaptic vesicle glycoprotein 2C isoform X2 [Pristis pectinata]
MPGRTSAEGEIFEQQESGTSAVQGNDHVALTFDEALKETGFGMFHMLLLIVCGWANASDAIEILCVSFLLPTAQCDLHLGTADMGWLTASIFLGMMIGGYVWGALADLKGRQRILVLSLSVNGVCGAASSLAPNYWTFLMLRFFSGVGVGGSLPVIFSYFSEFQPQHRRGCMVSALATFWMAGNILAAGFAWLVIPSTSLSFQLGSLHFRTWRIFVVLCSLPSLTSALVYAVWMPESPKYLMETRQEGEALRVFQWMFWWNHRRTARSFSVHRLLIPAVRKSSTKFYSSRAGWLTHQILKGMDPLHKLFSHTLRSTSTVLAVIFFSISFGFYGLWMWFPELLKRIEVSGGSACSSNWSSPSSKGVENVTCYPVRTAVYMEGFILAAANLPGNIFSILMMDLLGGKLLLCASLFLSGLSVFFIWEVKTKSQSLIMSCLFSAISVIAWNSLDVIGLELYPTHLRSSALGVFTGTSRIASILGNVAFGQLVDVNCTVPILLVAIMFFIGSVAGLKLPNIKNKELS